MIFFALQVALIAIAMACNSHLRAATFQVLRLQEIALTDHEFVKRWLANATRSVLPLPLGNA